MRHEDINGTYHPWHGDNERDQNYFVRSCRGSSLETTHKGFVNGVSMAYEPFFICIFKKISYDIFNYP
jgi:hypothetical protein